MPINNQRTLKVLVTGADGMVGRAVVSRCASSGDDVIGYNHETLDITNNDAVSAAFRAHSPDVAINCAAWTDVDGCQSDPQRADDVNALAVESLAENSRARGAIFITLSTDFVFDGTKGGFYTQRDDPNPASIYGESKLKGERLAQSANARTVIVRTGWVFGKGGRNFLSTVIERARRREPINVIVDACGTPTYADDLAERLRTLAQFDIPGIYHVVNGGMGATYEEFARAALEAAQCREVELRRIPMEALKRPAPRPRNSRLRCVLSEAIGLPPLRDWKVALNAFAARTSP